MRKIFTTDGLFVSKQNFRVFSVNKFYYSSFIWDPTVSGDRRLVGTSNLKCLLAQIWNTNVWSQLFLNCYLEYHLEYQMIRCYYGSCFVWSRLYFFSRLKIHSTSLELTFFTTTNSVLILLSKDCCWVIVSINFVICLKRLDISESMTIFPFKASIFHYNSDFL